MCYKTNEQLKQDIIDAVEVLIDRQRIERELLEQEIERLAYAGGVCQIPLNE